MGLLLGINAIIAMEHRSRLIGIGPVLYEDLVGRKAQIDSAVGKHGDSDAIHPAFHDTAQSLLIGVRTGTSVRATTLLHGNRSLEAAGRSMFRQLMSASLRAIGGHTAADQATSSHAGSRDEDHPAAATLQEFWQRRGRALSANGPER